MGPDPNGRIDRSLSRSKPAPRYHLRLVCATSSPSRSGPFYADDETERGKEFEEEGDISAARGSSLPSFFAFCIEQGRMQRHNFAIRLDVQLFRAGPNQGKRGARRPLSLFHEQEQKGLYWTREREERTIPRFIFRTSLSFGKRAREKVSALSMTRQVFFLVK